MKEKIKKQFNAHIRDGLETMSNHIVKRMNVYRKWYNLDSSTYKNKTRKAIMKDLSMKIGFGIQHGWLLSCIVLDELKDEEEAN